TEKEIRLWHKGFLKDCPNGLLTEQGFIKIYKQFFPQGDPSKFASLVFRVFDENNIKQDEVPIAKIRPQRIAARRAREILCLDINDDALWLDEKDVDTTNVPDVKNEVNCELMSSFQGQTPQPEDDNTPQKRVDKIFDQMDKNHDDRLTLEEFREGSKADPRIVQALSLGGD
ncbi:hypothetical protein HF086_017951, partial [Spodoptera exigua]